MVLPEVGLGRLWLVFNGERGRRNAEQFGEAELNIRKWAWPPRRPTTDEKRGRDGRRGRSENYSPGSERASDERRFFPRCWLAAPRRPSLPHPSLSLRPTVSRRVLGKRELCFRDTDVKRIKAYERQLNDERDGDRSAMNSDLSSGVGRESLDV